MNVKWVLLFAGSMIVCIFIGGNIGYSISESEHKPDPRGTFIVTLDALEDIRNQNVAQGIGKLETMCYFSAIEALEDPAVRKLYAKSLRDYRSQFATNKSAWTPTESNLEMRFRQP